MEIWTGNDDKLLNSWMQNFQESDGLILEDDEEVIADRDGHTVTLSLEDYRRLAEANQSLASATATWTARAQLAQRETQIARRDAGWWRRFALLSPIWAAGITYFVVR